MIKVYDEDYKESFLKGLKVLTGIPYKKLEEYADKNNLFNILEHPNTIGPSKQQYEKISLLNEFITTYRLLKMQETSIKITLSSSAAAGEYFSSLLSGVKDREKFMVAYLDNANNIIETRIATEGGVGEAVVYPRDILKAALDCDCRSIVLAHNHPGGTQKASKQDIDVTEKLVSIFTPLEISVLDHIIVTNSTYYSMAEKGIMPSSCTTKADYTPVKLEKEAFAVENNMNYEKDAVGEEDEEWQIC